MNRFRRHWPEFTFAAILLLIVGTVFACNSQLSAASEEPDALPPQSTGLVSLSHESASFSLHVSEIEAVTEAADTVESLRAENADLKLQIGDLKGQLAAVQAKLDKLFVGGPATPAPLPRGAEPVAPATVQAAIDACAQLRASLPPPTVMYLPAAGGCGTPQLSVGGCGAAALDASGCGAAGSASPGGNGGWHLGRGLGRIFGGRGASACGG